MDEAPKPADPDLLTRIARELATEQYRLEQILRRYDLDQNYFDEQIANNEFFKRVLADYTKEWQAPTSTHKRVALAAAAALEEKLPFLASRMGDPRSGLADAVATAKLFRELAGIAAPAPGIGASTGERFSISINFGHHKVALETRQEPPSAEALSDDTVRQIDMQPLRPVSEGASEKPPIQPLPSREH